MVKRKIKAHQVNELLSNISSSRLSEEDATTFITRFDKAFLDLYPTFIEEFNNLLDQPQIEKAKQPHSLTPEQRIYALIRLGVKESSEIATLLFYSPQTIYNYRSAVKNKAKNKDTFEDDIMNLCTVIR
jgi:DNA-binding CsgD family transcriptional regulator